MALSGGSSVKVSASTAFEDAATVGWATLSVGTFQDRLKSTQAKITMVIPTSTPVNIRDQAGGASTGFCSRSGSGRILAKSWVILLLLI